MLKGLSAEVGASVAYAKYYAAVMQAAYDLLANHCQMVLKIEAIDSLQGHCHKEI